MADDFEGHGWTVVPCSHINAVHAGERTNHRIQGQIAALHIGRLPGRKQICLYGHLGTPGVISTYAFFPDEEKARAALAILDRLMKP